MSVTIVYVLIDRSGSTKDDFDGNPIDPENFAPYIAFNGAFRTLCERLCEPFVLGDGTTRDLREDVRVMAYGYNDYVFPLLEHQGKRCEHFVSPDVIQHCQLVENINGSTGFHLALERVHLDLERDKKDEYSPINRLDYDRCLVINLTDGVFNPDTQEKVRQAYKKLIDNPTVRLLNIHVRHPSLRGINITDDHREFLRAVSSKTTDTSISNCYTDIPLDAVAKYVVQGTLTSICGRPDYH